jgi:circadian clock protein KaiC
MSVVKVRASDHSKEIREYEIGEEGIVLGDAVRRYEGLLGGRPTRATGPAAPALPR